MEPIPKKISYILTNSALGDTVCALPGVLALIKEDRIKKILAFPMGAELMRLAGVPEEYMVQMSKTQLTPYDPEDTYIIDALSKNSAPYRIHLVDFYTVLQLNFILKPEEKNIPKATIHPDISRFQLPENYVVLSAGFTYKSRSMPDRVLHDILEHLHRKNITPVFLGAQMDANTKHTQFYDTSGAMDLCGQTTITESAEIISGAITTIAVDSGLLYIAAMTDAHITGAYTFVDPYYRTPWRHNIQGWNFTVIEPKSKCKYCSNRLAAFGVTMDKTCPLDKNYECVESLDSQDFINAIDYANGTKILKSTT